MTETSPTATGSATIRGSWNMSADHIRAGTASYSDTAKTALLNLFLWCTDSAHPLSKPSAATRIGCSDNLLYKLLTGKYYGPNNELLEPAEDLVKSIAAFLAIEKERFESGETEFVLTPTARKLGNCCELARESNSIVFTWGPSQIGKTWGLVHHSSTHNHGRSPYVRLSAASGVSNMARRIASKCGISENTNNTELMIERIKRSITKDTLLILDECHLLFNTILHTSANRCFETLRGIHDETQCGMVLCFTMLDEMRARSGAQLQQLWRRGVHKVPLPLMPTKQDLSAILDHAGLYLPPPSEQIAIGESSYCPYEVLRDLAKNEGLKAITERLRYGRKLATRSGTKLTWKHVIDAHNRIAKQSTQEGEWK